MPGGSTGWEEWSDHPQLKDIISKCCKSGIRFIVESETKHLWDSNVKSYCSKCESIVKDADLNQEAKVRYRKLGYDV